MANQAYGVRSYLVADQECNPKKTPKQPSAGSPLSFAIGRYAITVKDTKGRVVENPAHSFISEMQDDTRNRKIGNVIVASTVFLRIVSEERMEDFINLSSSVQNKANSYKKSHLRELRGRIQNELVMPETDSTDSGLSLKADEATIYLSAMLSYNEDDRKASLMPELQDPKTLDIITGDIDSANVALRKAGLLHSGISPITMDDVTGIQVFRYHDHIDPERSPFRSPITPIDSVAFSGLGIRELNIR